MSLLIHRANNEIKHSDKWQREESERHLNGINSMFASSGVFFFAMGERRKISKLNFSLAVFTGALARLFFSIPFLWVAARTVARQTF